MPLHLRRRCDIWPDKGWPRNQYEVITDSGYTVGTILQPGNWSNDDWEWHINGDLVAYHVTATGRAATVEEAKHAVASGWRKWLAIKDLEETTHKPVFGTQRDEETRRRLRLPL
jgi:hypothetical protein